MNINKFTKLSWLLTIRFKLLEATINIDGEAGCSRNQYLHVLHRHRSDRNS